VCVCVFVSQSKYYFVICTSVRIVYGVSMCKYVHRFIHAYTRMYAFMYIDYIHLRVDLS